jgi:hypothetical protein
MNGFIQATVFARQPKAIIHSLPFRSKSAKAPPATTLEAEDDQIGQTMESARPWFWLQKERSAERTRLWPPMRGMSARERPCPGGGSGAPPFDRFRGHFIERSDCGTEESRVRVEIEGRLREVPHAKRIPPIAPDGRRRRTEIGPRSASISLTEALVLAAILGSARSGLSTVKPALTPPSPGVRPALGNATNRSFERSSDQS